MTKNCICSFYHWACKNAEENSVKKPGRMIVNTTDVLFDVSNLDSINDWILQTHSDFIDSRYGGWSMARSANNLTYPWINGTKTKAIVWYNNKAFHALPSYTNALHNAILRSLVPEDHRQDYGISTFSHPLTLSVGQININSM